MIKLEELKPVLEELLKDREDSVEVIDKIRSLDVHDYDLDSEAIRKQARDEVEAIWRKKYRDAFFNGPDTVEDKKEEIVEDKTKTVEDILKGEL